MKSRVSLAILLSSFLTLVPAGAQHRSAPAKTDAGQVAGTTQGQVISYRGLPYAAPPVGPLRWKAPQPVARWTGVRDATAYGAACPQPERKEFWAQVGRQGEDCLFLNVWRPARPGRYPVMVFVHGGGFSFGAAGVPLYDGARLAERGVVLVTLNYRLGRLGFFAHPALTREDPDGLLGNYGIMDQIAALKWVKRNIANFGGRSDQCDAVRRVGRGRVGPDTDAHAGRRGSVPQGRVPFRVRRQPVVSDPRRCAERRGAWRQMDRRARPQERDGRSAA